jgi:hypothetical protein
VIYDDLNKLAEVSAQKAIEVVESIRVGSTAGDRLSMSKRAETAATLAAIARDTLTNVPEKDPE